MTGADLVTEYDRAVENMISTSLKEKYPDYKYVSIVGIFFILLIHMDMFRLSISFLYAQLS